MFPHIREVAVGKAGVRQGWKVVRNFWDSSWLMIIVAPTLSGPGDLPLGVEGVEGFVFSPSPSRDVVRKLQGFELEKLADLLE